MVKAAKKVADKVVGKKTETKKAAPKEEPKKSKKATVKAANKEAITKLEEKINDEMSALSEHFDWNEVADAIATLDFFVDAKTDECAEKGCDNLRTTQAFCRTHYIANWYDIKKKREILKEGKLQDYIEELISKYPPKFIEAIVSDLSDEKDWYKALNELNISNDFDYNGEDFDGVDSDSDSGDDDISTETRDYTPTVRFGEEN